MITQLANNPPTGDLGSIPGSGRSAGEGIGYPLQYSGLENSMDCIVHGVTKSQTRLSNFLFHFTHRLRNVQGVPQTLPQHYDASKIKI